MQKTMKKKKVMICIGAICLCMCLELLFRKFMGLSLDTRSVIFHVILSPIIVAICVVWVLNTKWYKSRFGRK